VLAFWLRGRRRRRRELVAAADPHATLAATPDPIEPVVSAETAEAVDTGSGAGGEGPD
jgi:hypothetical protein